jgi:hypothetical protein
MGEGIVVGCACDYPEANICPPSSITTINVRSENRGILPILRPAVGGKQRKLAMARKCWLRSGG